MTHRGPSIGSCPHFRVMTVPAQQRVFCQTQLPTQITALASAKVAIPSPLQPHMPEHSNMCLLKLFQNRLYLRQNSMKLVEIWYSGPDWLVLPWFKISSSYLVPNPRYGIVKFTGNVINRSLRWQAQRWPLPTPRRLTASNKCFIIGAGIFVKPNEYLWNSVFRSE